MQSRLIRLIGTGSAWTLIALLAAGCEGPTGRTSRRVDVDKSTRAERKSGQMQTSDLAESSDTVAQSLANDINRLAAEDWKNVRVTVTFGDIKNDTRTMPTTDFEYVRERIKGKLAHSKLFRDNVKFVENRARMDELNAREYGTAEDPLQQGGGGAPAVQRTDPKYAYYLNGNAYGVHRGTTHLYYVSFKLNRASDGEEVFSQEYEVKYHK